MGPVDYLAVEAIGAVEQVVGRRDIALGQCGADAGAGDLGTRLGDCPDNAEPHAGGGAEFFQRVDGAGAGASEAEVVSLDEGGGPKGLHQNLLEEGFGIPGQERCADAQECGMGGARLAQQGESVFGGGEGRGDGLTKQGAGVRIERERQHGEIAEVAGEGGGGLDKRDMPLMDAVEIAQRDNRAGGNAGVGIGGEGGIEHKHGLVILAENRRNRAGLLVEGGRVR